MHQKKISVVVPLFNEEDSVKPLCRSITAALEPMNYEFEIILIDDGSTDESFVRANEIALNDERVHVLKLSRNFGQTPALYAGLEYASGGIIVTMDGDLQNDPSDIPGMVEKIDEGYDVVTGWREKRKDTFITRKLPSKIANWIIRKMMASEIIDNGCALRAYKADVIRKFPLYSEMHRLLPTLLTLSGTKIAQMQVKHHARKYGSSKYGLSRTYKVIIDLMALKMIMTSVRFSFFGFGHFALFSFMIGLFIFGGGIAYHVVHPEGTMVVFIGASMLMGALSIALFMFGILTTMIYSLGNLRVEDLLKKEFITT